MIEAVGMFLSALVVMAWLGLLILLAAAIRFAIIDLLRRRRVSGEYPAEISEDEYR